MSAIFSRVSRKVAPQAEWLRRRLLGRLQVDGCGERVDLVLADGITFDALDIYQKAHYRRYEYAARLVGTEDVVADMACGTGYGTAMLAASARQAIGFDVSRRAVRAACERYRTVANARYVRADLLKLHSAGGFSAIVSFETLEHLPESRVPVLLRVFNTALVPDGRLVLSTPYKQHRSPEALRLGFHKVFDIDESRVSAWLGDAGFRVESLAYQSYAKPDIEDAPLAKDFLIVLARRVS